MNLALSHAATLAQSAQPRRSHPATVLVTVAVIITAAIGLIDLTLTSYFMSTTGMCELNPLARAVAMLGLPCLVAFKLLVTGVNAGVIWAFRACRSGQIAALLSLLIMTALAVHWGTFLYEGSRIGFENTAGIGEHDYVRL